MQGSAITYAIAVVFPGTYLSITQRGSRGNTIRELRNARLGTKLSDDDSPKYARPCFRQPVSAPGFSRHQSAAEGNAPLVDKPIIQYGVEEAMHSGIQNIIIVTGRGKSAIEDHFDVSFELENLLETRERRTCWQSFAPSPT